MTSTEGAQGVHSWLRRSLLLSSLILSLAGILAMLNLALDFEEIGSFKTNMDAALRAAHLNRNFAAAGAKRDVHKILMLGDSMLMSRKETGYDVGYSLPGRVWEVLEELAPDADPAHHVVASHYPGEGYSSFYFFADLFIAAGPDQVLIEFNPGAMSARWRERFSRTDHVAFLGWRRIPEALTLPLHRLGITADRVLWTNAFRELGYVGLWREVTKAQGRVTKLRNALHQRVAALTGSQAEQPGKGPHSPAGSVVVRMPSIGAAENAACFSYSQSSYSRQEEH
jgi:hypothetical protein